MTITSNMNTVIIRLMEAGCTTEGAFGVLGNLYAESGVVPNNLENYYAQKWGITDEEYTEMVNDGRITREQFISEAGYGIAQWTFWSRKAGLYDLAKNNLKSIDDIDMQAEYLIRELKTYEDVWETITNSRNLKECSDIVLLDFERPADQSAENRQRRYEIGKELMESYKPEPVVPDTARERVVKTADYYVGCVQYDERHKRIIDIYNSHTPRARGYKMSYDDQWCAAFASGVYIECGYADYFPLEVGCGRMIDKAKEMGIWVEDDDFVPSIGDGVMYNFDGKPGEETDHGADHVGLVVYVADGKIHTVEGNMGSGYCGTRTLVVGDQWIRGFIHVNLPDDPTPPVPPTPPTPGGYCEVKLRILGTGDTGNDVVALQGILEAHGYDLEYCGGCDGIFGSGTEYAVKRYQQTHNLDVDGVVGEKTWSSLLQV